MPLSSPCLYLMLWRCSSLMLPSFTGTARVSPKREVGMRLSSHFVSKHSRKKGSFQLRSEAISLDEVYTEHNAVIYHISLLSL